MSALASGSARRGAFTAHDVATVGLVGAAHISPKPTSRAVLELRSQGREVGDEILSHISPGHSDNINFFGVMNMDVEAELAKLDTSGSRPLRPAQLRELGLTP
ncbi:hypothetical protein ABZ297_26365 [Nonomuraea sp. NPDC005983]|uniref:hypothetical protein n=1 Tax=Nonomuraea sp. NPDC005983 TaxID=3155595 RepID=UPI0033B71D32